MVMSVHGEDELYRTGHMQSTSSTFNLSILSLSFKRAIHSFTRASISSVKGHRRGRKRETRGGGGGER